MDEYRSLVDKLLSRQVRMEAGRTQFEAIWQEIADRIIPRKAQFTKRNTPNQTKGQRSTDRIFDATPALALDRYAAAVHSLVVPKNNVWHQVTSSDAELSELPRVKRYFEEWTELLFKARYAGNFDTSVHECFYDHGAFATMVLHIGDNGRKLTYSAIPMHQAYLAENAAGVVDLLHRKYPLTARQAMQEFDPARLPDMITRAARDTPEREFTFLHVCQPNGEPDADRLDYRGMPIAQYEVCVDSRTMVEVSGYWSFPYAVGRYSAAPGEIYGRGPAEIVLPDVKMLNEMNKTTMQGAQLRVLPPLLAQKQGILDAVRITPAAVNYGGINANGQPLIRPLESGGDPGLGIELMDQKRRIVQDAFWNTLFQILVENKTMTATEAMLRAQEKGALLAPTASRIESEFLQPAITAEMHYLARRGLAPEPPDEVIEAGAGFQLDYDSPMSRARKAEQGIAILRTWEQLTPLAEATGGRVFKRFNMDKSAQLLAEANGYPSEAIYTDDELAELDAKEQQAQSVAAAVEAAPALTQAAKNLAQAQALSQASPSSSPVPV